MVYRDGKERLAGQSSIAQGGGTMARNYFGHNEYPTA